MCGITGFLDFSRSSRAEELNTLIRRMMATLQHRGPDDGGAWVDETIGLAFGFQRLSILDLTPAGHQPMFSADGRYVVIFNGEIYNFAELRAELLRTGSFFRGASDTEVLLAAITAWGLEEAVRRFNGMFAFALWDTQTRRLHLVRDRLGIKPLYYGWCGPALVFGSELKPLKAYSDFQSEVDRAVLTLYLRSGYIPAPYSIYKNIFKVLPGTILTIDENRQEQRTTYWSLSQVAEYGVTHPFSASASDLITNLDDLLRTAVRARMVADVPLGAFLSGGIDSSLVVALMQVQSNRPVKTFTIGFEEAAYDEARFARAVAQHLGTDHTELYVTPQQALAIIPRLPFIYDEPFADPSQIPIFLVAKLARETVTVSLSGDGGDELFSGYIRYAQTRQLWRWLRLLSSSTRNHLGQVIQSATRIGLHIRSQRINRTMDRAAKLADILDADAPHTFYQRLVSFHNQPETVVQNNDFQLGLSSTPTVWPQFPSVSELIMYMDISTYLPDDILVKLDRATMAVSLEGRVPLLDDHRIIEFAWRVPLEFKERAGQGKWLLRQLLYRYVPKKLVDRPKMGFSVPVETWLRGPLRDWAETLLAPERLKREGYFKPEPILLKWHEHLSGKRNWSNFLWTVINFQAWWEVHS